MQIDKPDVAIFLDIDGVLGPTKFDLFQLREMNKKVIELIGDRFHTLRCERCDTCSFAQAHLFKKEIIDSFHELIRKVQEVANVHIVISSTWRKGRSIEELKELFSMHEFSKYIIDKTIEEEPDFEKWKNLCIYPHIEVSLENYLKQSETPNKLPTNAEYDAFVLANWECRASQINRWLKEHPQFEHFIVFDDIDECLSLNFKDKFISTKNYLILTAKDCNKAYNSLLTQLRLNI